MKRKQTSLFYSLNSFSRTLARFMLASLVYGFWSLILGVLMLPYQVYRVFMPVKKGRPGGSRISKWFKGAFESKKSRKFIGAGLSVLIMFFGLFGNILAADELQTDETILTTPETELVTQRSLNKPFDGILAQGFHGFHRGIDVLAPFGTEMRPIAEGEVIEVSFGRIGWGNTVVIKHDHGLVSRYAHLDEIRVVEGEKIGQDQVLGTVGMTGWTTGPHLHLEIYENGRAINPAEILPEFNPQIAYER